MGPCPCSSEGVYNLFHKLINSEADMTPIVEVQCKLHALQATVQLALSIASILCFPQSTGACQIAQQIDESNRERPVGCIQVPISQCSSMTLPMELQLDRQPGISIHQSIMHK